MSNNNNNGTQPKKKRKPRRKKNQPIKSKGSREVDGIQVQEWQKMPKRVLREYCQKNKLQKPKFSSNRD